MELKREARLLYCTVATSQEEGVSVVSECLGTHFWLTGFDKTADTVCLLHPCCISVWDVLPRQHPRSPSAAASAVTEQHAEQLLIDALHLTLIRTKGLIVLLLMKRRCFARTPTRPG